MNHPVHGKLLWKSGDAFFKVLAMYDYSAGGLGLKVDVSLQRGELVHLTLIMPDGETEYDAQVAWSRPTADLDPEEVHAGLFNIGVSF